jgi:hypothetical protein
MINPKNPAKGLMEKLKKTQTMVAAVVEWFKGIMVLLDKERGGMNKPQLMEMFKKMAILVEQYKAE